MVRRPEKISSKGSFSSGAARMKGSDNAGLESSPTVRIPSDTEDSSSINKLLVVVLLALAIPTVHGRSASFTWLFSALFATIGSKEIVPVGAFDVTLLLLFADDSTLLRELSHSKESPAFVEVIIVLSIKDKSLKVEEMDSRLSLRCFVVAAVVDVGSGGRKKTFSVFVATPRFIAAEGGGGLFASPPPMELARILESLPLEVAQNKLEVLRCVLLELLSSSSATAIDFKFSQDENIRLGEFLGEFVLSCFSTGFVVSTPPNGIFGCSPFASLQLLFVAVLSGIVGSAAADNMAIVRFISVIFFFICANLISAVSRRFFSSNNFFSNSLFRASNSLFLSRCACIQQHQKKMSERYQMML